MALACSSASSDSLSKSGYCARSSHPCNAISIATDASWEKEVEGASTYLPSSPSGPSNKLACTAAAKTKLQKKNILYDNR